MKAIAIIPARYASSRFPGKPLIDIKGKTMIQRVYEQASKAFEIVYVATDDQRIYDHVVSLKYNVIMTSVDHQSGTDRCAEAVDLICQSTHTTYDVVVNVQGDEPFIKPDQLLKVIEPFNDANTQITTLVKKITTYDELFDVNKPKVVVDKYGKALYFSRHTIPFLRNIEKEKWLEFHHFFKHIGLYAYRTDILKLLTQLPQSSLEKAESLEQLRWIENGFSIAVVETEFESISIDTPDDLKKIETLH